MFPENPDPVGQKMCPPRGKRWKIYQIFDNFLKIGEIFFRNSILGKCRKWWDFS
jgi:hypothetical protein